MSSDAPAPLPEKVYARWRSEAPKTPRRRVTDRQLKHLFAHYCRSLLSFYRNEPKRIARIRRRDRLRHQNKELVKPIFAGLTD